MKCITPGRGLVTLITSVAVVSALAVPALAVCWACSRNPAETFNPRNGLAENRPQSVM